MNPQKLSFIVDECLLGKKTVDSLSHLLENIHRLSASIVHITTLFPVGTCDTIWVPQVARNGSVILTADQGKQSTRPKKMFLICKETGVICFAFSSKLSQTPSTAKAIVIPQVWKEMVETALAAEKGCCFLITRKGLGYDFKRK